MYAIHVRWIRSCDSRVVSGTVSRRPEIPMKIWASKMPALPATNSQLPVIWYGSTTMMYANSA